MKETERFISILTASHSAYQNTSEPYLAKWCHITEGSILNDLVSLAGVAQLSIALHSLRGQADTCGLTACGVRGVQVVVALKDHQLAFSLGDMGGKGFEDVAERHLHFDFKLCSCCQAGGQLHFIKLPTVWEQVRRNRREHG